MSSREPEPPGKSSSSSRKPEILLWLRSPEQFSPETIRQKLLESPSSIREDTLAWFAYGVVCVYHNQSVEKEVWRNLSPFLRRWLQMWKEWMDLQKAVQELQNIPSPSHAPNFQQPSPPASPSPVQPSEHSQADRKRPRSFVEWIQFLSRTAESSLYSRGRLLLSSEEELHQIRSLMEELSSSSSSSSDLPPDG